MNIKRHASLIISISIAAGMGPLALGAQKQDGNYAQTLLESAVAETPAVLGAGMHVTAPGAKDNTIVAMTNNRQNIGHKSDEDDLAVADEGKTILATSPKDRSRFEVLLPLKDASGKRIGALGLVFHSVGGDDVEILQAAIAFRNALQSRIPNIGALFAPAP